MSHYVVVEGGGFRLLTADPIMIAVVRRCAELERNLLSEQLSQIAKYRTLRRDVRQIKRAVLPRKTSPRSGGV